MAMPASEGGPRPGGGREHRHVPVKDFYGVDDVAALLHMSANRVYELASRDDDPMPFRRLVGARRGMFVSRAELVPWVMRNTMLAHGGGKPGPPDG